MMSSFWSGWIIVLTSICLLLILWILLSVHRGQRKNLTNETTGHVYDGIEELDNPMPHWWFLLFIASFIFSAGYLLLYPGFGHWQGVLNWTAKNQLESREGKHQRRYGPIFAQYAKEPITKLVNNPKALKMGKRIFLNNCVICHGLDAHGNYGFPNLTDNDWLYGGDANSIQTTILYGRRGQMPSWVAIIGEDGVKSSATYVRSLSGITEDIDRSLLSEGKKVFRNTCSVCHQSNGKGNHAVGAPNLTDNIWLYGSSQAQVEYTIRNGRNGVMPVWKDVLGKEKVHLVATYIYSLSKANRQKSQKK